MTTSYFPAGFHPADIGPRAADTLAAALATIKADYASHWRYMGNGPRATDEAHAIEDMIGNLEDMVTTLKSALASAGEG